VRGLDPPAGDRRPRTSPGRSPPATGDRPLWVARVRPIGLFATVAVVVKTGRAPMPDISTGVGRAFKGDNGSAHARSALPRPAGAGRCVGGNIPRQQFEGGGGKMASTEQIKAESPWLCRGGG